MGIKAFYRNWVGVVGKYTYTQANRTEEVFTDIKYYKGNIQPWKEGMGQFNSGGGGFVFEDFNLLYTKSDVTFEEPDGIPPTATNITFFQWWFFHNGKWYFVKGDEDWSYAGRQPKHHKYYGQYLSGQEDIIDDVGVPIPLGELVDQFQNVVSELNQVSNLY